MLQFLPLALDSKAGTGLTISANQKAEYTTIFIYVGVALDPNQTRPGTGDWMGRGLSPVHYLNEEIATQKLCQWP